MKTTSLTLYLLGGQLKLPSAEAIYVRPNAQNCITSNAKKPLKILNSVRSPKSSSF